MGELCKTKMIEPMGENNGHGEPLTNVHGNGRPVKGFIQQGGWP